MEKLTQLQKNVLLLIFVMDFSYETVANIMAKKQWLADRQVKNKNHDKGININML